VILIGKIHQQVLLQDLLKSEILFGFSYVFLLNSYRVDSEFSGRARAQMLNDGCTAVIAAVHNGKIIVGNGDIHFFLLVL
jgi:hypothetical protein